MIENFSTIPAQIIYTIVKLSPGGNRKKERKGVVSGGREKGGGVSRDSRARMLEELRTVETGSVFSDRDDVTF